jgi:broad specificity phosphatase PhoE
MNICFMRHSESVDDIEDRYGGWVDYGLTDRGEEQAKTAAILLSDKSYIFDKILHSPLPRAVEVGQILSEHLQVEKEEFAYLKERNSYGIFSGMQKTYVESKYQQYYRLLKQGERDSIPGAEQQSHFIDRVKMAVEALSKRNEQTLLAVTHGGFMKTMFAEYFKVELIHVADCGYAWAQLEGDELYLGDIFGIDIKS